MNASELDQTVRARFAADRAMLRAMNVPHFDAEPGVPFKSPRGGMQVTLTTVVSATSDGVPVVTDRWCQCERPRPAVYFEQAGGFHGWACSFCRQVTQVG